MAEKLKEISPQYVSQRDLESNTGLKGIADLVSADN
jgi:hypothetical protein